MKRIILCADDYGQNAAISQAIIELLSKNRLSATSCMTNSYYWPVHANWLEPFKDHIDVGLHFNLTYGKPLSKQFGADFLPLSQLIIKSYLKQLDTAVIDLELNAQLDQFVEGYGKLPDFIDGHQHIHQLPMIRDVIFSVYEKRLKESGCYIRSVYDPKAFLRVGESAYFKSIIIQLCGASTFKHELIKKNIPHNVSFSGMYNFADSAKYSIIFPHFLTQITDNGLIMCHPGLASSTEEDAITNSRYLEYQFFLSDQFVNLCKTEQVILGKFK